LAAAWKYLGIEPHYEGQKARHTTRCFWSSRVAYEAFREHQRVCSARL